MFLNNDKIWESEKNKFNTELKKYQEKVTSLESELKVKDETLQKWQTLPFHVLYLLSLKSC